MGPSQQRLPSPDTSHYTPGSLTGEIDGRALVNAHSRRWAAAWCCPASNRYRAASTSCTCGCECGCECVTAAKGTQPLPWKPLAQTAGGSALQHMNSQQLQAASQKKHLLVCHAHQHAVLVLQA